MIKIGINYFYSSDADIREVHAEIISNKISNCLTENYYFSENSESKFNIFKVCGINQDLFSGSGKYYLFVSVHDLDEVLIDEIKLGNLDYDVYCGLEASKNSKNLPKCSFKEGVLGFDSKTLEEYKFDVVFGSNNLGGFDKI